jgi:hypothetical protein
LINVVCFEFVVVNLFNQWFGGYFIAFAAFSNCGFSPFGTSLIPFVTEPGLFSVLFFVYFSKQQNNQRVCFVDLCVHVGGKYCISYFVANVAAINSHSQFRKEIWFSGFVTFAKSALLLSNAVSDALSALSLAVVDLFVCCQLCPRVGQILFSRFVFLSFQSQFELCFSFPFEIEFDCCLRLFVQFSSVCLIHICIYRVWSGTTR